MFNETDEPCGEERRVNGVLREEVDIQRAIEAIVRVFIENHFDTKPAHTFAPCTKEMVGRVRPLYDRLDEVRKKAPAG